MKLKNSDIIALFRALSTLDAGHEAAVHDAEGAARAVRVPFQFAGGIRLWLIRALRAVRDLARDIDQVRDQLVREISGGKDRIETGEIAAIEHFTRMFRSVLDDQVEIGIVPIDLEALSLDRNPIPWAGCLEVLDRLGLLRDQASASPSATP